MREYFYIRFSTHLMENYTVCKNESKDQLTEIEINNVARKLEYNIVCDTRVISRYKFLAAKKVNYLFILN